MSLLFDLIKKENIDDGASEEFVDNAAYIVESALNYWITLNQAIPENEQDVLAIGTYSSIGKNELMHAVVKYKADGSYFLLGDSVFKVFGWRPLPGLELSSFNI